MSMPDGGNGGNGGPGGALWRHLQQRHTHHHEL
jgi:hypothetical protein